MLLAALPLAGAALPVVFVVVAGGASFFFSRLKAPAVTTRDGAAGRPMVCAADELARSAVRDLRG